MRSYTLAYLRKIFRVQSKVLTFVVGKDKAAKLDETLKGVQDDFNEHRIRDAFKGINSTKAYRPKPANMILLEDGTYSKEPLEVRDRWKRHWIEYNIQLVH